MAARCTVQTAVARACSARAARSARTTDEERHVLSLTRESRDQHAPLDAGPLFVPGSSRLRNGSQRVIALIEAILRADGYLRRASAKSLSLRANLQT